MFSSKADAQSYTVVMHESPNTRYIDLKVQDMLLMHTGFNTDRQRFVLRQKEDELSLGHNQKCPHPHSIQTLFLWLSTSTLIATPSVYLISADISMPIRFFTSVPSSNL